MKKTLFLILGFLAAGAAFASSVPKVEVDQSALAVDTVFPIDLNASDAQRVAVQAVYSKAAPVAKSFTDGSQSTGQITVASTATLASGAASDTLTVDATANLTALQATNRITVLSTTSLTNAQITVNGHVYRAGSDWTPVGTASGTAAAIAAFLDVAAGIDASRTGTDAVVYATATAPGTYGNTFTLTSNTTNIVVLNPTFTGGRDKALTNAYVTLNGVKLRNGYEWAEAATSSGTAANICVVINRLPGVVASTSSSVITITATTAGSAGNSFTLSGSTAALAAASANFTGGRDTAIVTIGGVSLAAGSAWTAVNTASGCAKAISDAIQANSALAANISSTWTVQGIVYATSTAVGQVNFTLVSNTSGLVASGGSMTGGVVSAYAVGTGGITIPSHGMTTGLAVVFTTGTANTGITNFTNGTTYYAIPTDANTVYLASSKANAQNGIYIILGSSSVSTGHTFTLTPSAFSGTPFFKWEGSNDGANFNDVAVSSVTYSSPSTSPTSTLWDLGAVNFRYLQLNVIAPTTGGLKIKVTSNIKKEG